MELKNIFKMTINQRGKHMAIKDLMKATKADRYTADGRDQLNEALQADVEDRTYKTGEISEKTGLQKQPDGSWAPPKKGGLGSGTGKKETGNKEQKRQKHIAANAQHQFEAASETANSEIDQANLKSIKSFMDEEHATFKNALYSKAETLARRGARGNPDPENEKSLLKFAEAAGMADDLKLYLKEEVNSKYEFGGAESKPTDKYKDLPGAQKKDALYASTFEGSSIGMTQTSMERQGWDLIQADDDVNVYAKPDGSKVTMKHDGKRITSTEYEAPGSKPGRDFPALKNKDHVELAEEVKSNTMPGSDWTAEEIAKEWRLGKADAEEVKKEFDKIKTRSTNAPVRFPRDSAPRQLTGDCKIRVRRK